MNDEIKEILEYIRKWMGLSEIPMIVKLEDYMTNLQQRCEYLERSNNRREDTIIGLRFEVAEQEDYKSRCEKAIEVIKQFDTDKNFTFPLMPKWEEKQVKASIKLEFKDTYKRPLLNILQNGDDSQ